MGFAEAVEEGDFPAGSDEDLVGVQAFEAQLGEAGVAEAELVGVPFERVFEMGGPHPQQVALEIGDHGGGYFDGFQVHGAEVGDGEFDGHASDQRAVAGG